VHIGDHVDHSRQSLVGRVDDHVDPFAQDIELGVGHQHRDLDEPVGLQIQAGHLAVDPDQFVTHDDHSRPTPDR
jgi:hypothetical protein